MRLIHRVEPVEPDARPAGVAGRAAGPGRPVRPLEVAAHGAHGLRAGARRPLRAGPGRRARPRRVDPHGHRRRRRRRGDAGDRADLHRQAVGERRAAADPRRRGPAGQGRAARSSSSSSPRAEPAVRAAAPAPGRGRSTRSAPAASSTSSIGPERSTRPWRSISTCVDVGGMSSTWCVTTTVGGASGIGGEVVERLDELLATAEVEAGRRLVEEHDGRVVHQRAGEQHPLALARRQRLERPLGEAGDAHPLEAVERPGVVVGRCTCATTARARRTGPCARRRGPRIDARSWSASAAEA